MDTFLQSLNTTNYSIMALPFYYVQCVLPHAYAIYVASRGNPGNWDNRNPRSSGLKSSLSSRLGPQLYAKYERAEAAHYNGLESFPLLAAAVLAGNLARLPVLSLNKLVFGVGAIRTAYIVAYIATTRQALTWVRSGLWMAGLGWCLRVLYDAGKILS